MACKIPPYYCTVCSCFVFQKIFNAKRLKIKYLYCVKRCIRKYFVGAKLDFDRLRPIQGVKISEQASEVPQKKWNPSLIYAFLLFHTIKHWKTTSLQKVTRPYDPMPKDSQSKRSRSRSIWLLENMACFLMSLKMLSSSIQVNIVYL